jgi:hypothetical protein
VPGKDVINYDYSNDTCSRARPPVRVRNYNRKQKILRNVLLLYTYYNNNVRRAQINI